MILLSPIKELVCLIIQEQKYILQTYTKLQALWNNIHAGLTPAHDKLV